MKLFEDSRIVVKAKDFVVIHVNVDDREELNAKYKRGGTARCVGSGDAGCAALAEALRAQGALVKGAAGTFVVGGLFAVASVALGVVVAKPVRVQVVPAVGMAEGGAAVVGSW